MLVNFFHISFINKTLYLIGILSQIAKRINPNKHQQQQQQNQFELSHNNQISGNNGEHQEDVSKSYDKPQLYTDDGKFFCELN